MTTIASGAWEQARDALAARWREIVRRIDARDESGVLVLANQMDEFCDLALIERSRGRGTGDGHLAADVPAIPRSLGDPRCEFCRGFTEAGGCLGALTDVDRAVLAGDWARARRSAERYLRRVEEMTFDEAQEPPRRS